MTTDRFLRLLARRAPVRGNLGTIGMDAATKEYGGTWKRASVMSALPPKADILGDVQVVRQVPPGTSCAVLCRDHGAGRW
jgi:hypothetical protein